MIITIWVKNSMYKNTIIAMGLEGMDIYTSEPDESFVENQDKWAKVVSYFRWFPDLFWDIITPKTGGIRLDLDQRVFLRAQARMPTGYYTFGRSYGKTMLQLMGLFHTAIFFPRISLAMTAQTQQKAIAILREKYSDLCKFYPLLNEEIATTKFGLNETVIVFKNGSKIDILPNSQTAKGSRRHRGSIEEDNLVDENIYNDAVRPVFDDPRRTIGPHPTVDPNENNSSVSSYTTAGYRGSPAWQRALNRYTEMVDLKGSISLGASWRLAAINGRGKAVSEILKSRDNPILFDMNYMSHWTGCGQEGLVSLKKLFECRRLEKAEVKGNVNFDYVLSVDVARSNRDSICQTVVAILKIIRYSNGKIKEVQVVNIVPFEGSLNFTAQAMEVKRLDKLFNAEAIVVDYNGLGKGLQEELCKEQIDPYTNESLGCYSCLNDDSIESEIPNSPKKLFLYLGQSFDQEAIPTFMEYVDTSKLCLLIKKEDMRLDSEDTKEFKEKSLPFIQTDFFVEEVSNLKLKTLNNGRLTIEQATKTVPKDRFSAIEYGLWYIKKYMNYVVVEQEDDDRFLAKLAQWW